MSDDDIIAQFISNIIMTIFKKDYPYIQELIEYKRDGTLALLKAQDAIAFYNANIGLKVRKDVKKWSDFITFSKTYTKTFIQKILQEYQNKEKDNKKKQFQILDMAILGPAIEIFFNYINDSHLKKFPQWPTFPGTIEDYIKLYMKNLLEMNCFKFYWECRGIIHIKDTKYNYPVNGYPYRTEYFAKPELLISCFELDKIRLINEMAKSKMPIAKIWQIRFKVLRR